MRTGTGHFEFEQRLPGLDVDGQQGPVRLRENELRAGLVEYDTGRLHGLLLVLVEVVLCKQAPVRGCTGTTGTPRANRTYRPEPDRLVGRTGEQMRLQRLNGQRADGVRVSQKHFAQHCLIY